MRKGLPRDEKCCRYSIVGKKNICKLKNNFKTYFFLNYYRRTKTKLAIVDLEHRRSPLPFWDSLLSCSPLETGLSKDEDQYLYAFDLKVFISDLLNPG